MQCNTDVCTYDQQWKRNTERFICCWVCVFTISMSLRDHFIVCWCVVTGGRELLFETLSFQSSFQFTTHLENTARTVNDLFH